VSALTAKPDSDDRLRIFAFGTRGYMSVVLECLLADPRVRVVGLCAGRPAGLWLRARKLAGTVQRRLRLRGRNDFFVCDPFHRSAEPWTLAVRNNIPCHSYQDVRSESFCAALRATRPDLLLVAGFPRLIPAEVIALPSRLGINLHPSLLPRHRGGTPNRWIVRQGERASGITAHVLDARFDTGDILGQWPVALEIGETWGDVEGRILGLLPGVVDAVVTGCIDGSLHRAPQPIGAGEYEPPFHGRHAWIDWNLPFDEIERTCLAIRPKTGALTALQGRRHCVWSVVRAAADDEGGSLEPGTILRLDARGRPVVACGGGETLAIDRIVAYGAVMPSRNRREFQPGLRFNTVAAEAA